MGKPPDLALEKVTDREHRIGKLLLGELAEEVALVFARVASCQDAVHGPAVDFFRNFPAIMPRSNHVGTEFFRALKKGCKLYLPVAQYIRVRSSSFFIFIEHIVHDSCAVLPAQVHEIERDSDFPCHHFGNEPVLLPFTVSMKGGRGIVPVLHEQRKHIITLLFQKQGGNT